VLGTGFDVNGVFVGSWVGRSHLGRWGRRFVVSGRCAGLAIFHAIFKAFDSTAQV
jgi:hypothetical protein